jgi:chromosome segregation ATPase
MRPRNQPTDSVGAVILPSSLPEPSHAQPVQPGVVVKAKEEFERTLNQNLERLDEEIRELQSKAVNLKEAAKAEWAEKMAKLEAKRDEAGEKLDEIRKSTGEAWEHLRDGADKAWEELERSVKAAVKEF